MRLSTCSVLLSTSLLKWNFWQQTVLMSLTLQFYGEDDRGMTKKNIWSDDCKMYHKVEEYVFRSQIQLQNRAYFKSVWTAVNQFWAHLIWALKLGKRGRKVFVKVKIDISCKYFFFFIIPKKCTTLI